MRGDFVNEKKQALIYLQKALNNPLHTAKFRTDQWESIETLLNPANNKVLLVQRTGWGKSIVYFVATKLFRDRGRGPTLIISPLLSLMRNQMDAANRMGIVSQTINSTNSLEWDDVEQKLKKNKIDLLFVSPERLANEKFMSNVLSKISGNISLFVIDEAHCISDWGHDFRPDYRRIVRLLNAMPDNIPICATTATANDRVVKDVKSQLGSDIEVIRGPLVRKSLRLQTITLPEPIDRLAWLANYVPKMEGTGIIYTLTIRDAERVALWLQENGIDAKAYHAGRAEYSKVPEGIDRIKLEGQLLRNEIKVLVATVALGMGFDKPDLGFVIHYQSPGSVVHYYQQVGRAGRALDNAFAILLKGLEDDNIIDHFRETAFPPLEHVEKVLDILKKSDTGFSTVDFQKELNLSAGQIGKVIKFLDVESPSPITKIDTKWRANPSADQYELNLCLINRVKSVRLHEQKQMQEYMDHQGCLMAFQQNALDDPNRSNCGKCVNCDPGSFEIDSDFTAYRDKAALFLNRLHTPIELNKRWPPKTFLKYNFQGSSNELSLSEGRSLTLWKDSGLGMLVWEGKYKTNHFSEKLVEACVKMLKQSWKPEPFPSWATFVPSKTRPRFVSEFSENLAGALGISFLSVVSKVRNNKPQKNMQNANQQVKNLDGVFQIEHQKLPTGPCLLIDDIMHSGWTFSVVGALLGQAGVKVVYPMALTLNDRRSK